MNLLQAKYLSLRFLLTGIGLILFFNTKAQEPLKMSQLYEVYDSFWYKWTPLYEDLYEYDEFGRVARITSKTYNEIEEVFEIDREVYRKYDAQGRVIQYDYSYYFDQNYASGVSFRWREDNSVKTAFDEKGFRVYEKYDAYNYTHLKKFMYKYGSEYTTTKNDFGCIVADLYQSIDENGVYYLDQKTDYTRDANCRINSETSYYINSGWERNYKRQYYYDDFGNLTQMKGLDWDKSVYTWVLSSTFNYRYNDSNQEIEYHYISEDDDQYQYIRTTTYDEDGRIESIVGQHNSLLQNEWKIEHETFYEYDTDGRQIERLNVSYYGDNEYYQTHTFDTYNNYGLDSSLTQITYGENDTVTEYLEYLHNYQYRCDGEEYAVIRNKIKHEINGFPQELKDLTRKTNTYNRFDWCDSFIPTAEVNVFPNPSTDYIYINSILLGEETTTLAIYDASGRTLYMNKPNLTHQLKIEIRNYQPGTYYVKLFNDKTSLTSSFVKL